jgi:hypothetical protein
VYTTTVGVVSVVLLVVWIGSCRALVHFLFFSLFRLDVFVFVLENKKLLCCAPVVRSRVFYSGVAMSMRKGEDRRW